MKKRNCVCEGGIDVKLPLPTRLAQIHTIIQSNLIQAFEKSSKQYNLRSRLVSYILGQVLFVRTHPVSSAGQQCLSKFADKFLLITKSWQVHIFVVMK